MTRMETIKLGGNIELVNTTGIDGASMIILKKMIGSYARKFSERGIDSLCITFNASGVNVDALREQDKISTSAESENVFFAIDNAFKDLDTRV